MTDTLVPTTQGALIKFDPTKTRVRQRAHNVRLEELARIQDWPSLEEAVDLKVAEQEVFVAWWGATVRDPGQPKKELSQNGDNSLSVADAEKQTGIKKQQKSRWHVHLKKDADGYRKDLFQSAYRKGMALKKGEGAHVAQSAGDNEWYTPEEYVAAARVVMKGIDLDPASSAAANKVVRATKFYTVADSPADAEGHPQFTEPWAGRVWMNPPYAQPLVADFCKKLGDAFTLGTVIEACILVNNATETSWFQDLATCASALCLPLGRVKFWAPGKKATPLQGQVVLYLGKKPASFRDEFSAFGLVWRMFS